MCAGSTWLKDAWADRARSGLAIGERVVVQVPPGLLKQREAAQVAMTTAAVRWAKASYKVAAVPQLWPLLQAQRATTIPQLGLEPAAAQSPAPTPHVPKRALKRSVPAITQEDDRTVRARAEAEAVG